MATEKQIAANRKNAKKSTGPKTAEGKAKSSMNALKHGLSTPYGLLPGESEEEYAYHREELLDELYPDSSIEQYLADRIVYLSWTLKRAAHFIRVTLHNLLGETSGHPLPDDEHPDVYLARMVVRDFSNNHVIERLEIYERRIENSLYKTMREYEKQKKQSAQTHRTQPRPSSPARDPHNPFYVHTELCHAERSEASAEPPEAESNVGWDESHQSIPAASDESHQSTLSASDEPHHSDPNRQSPPLPTPPQGVLRRSPYALPTDPEPPTSVLNKQTQFPPAETEDKSSINKDLYEDAAYPDSADQTQSGLSEITSHPLVHQAQTVGSELTAARALLDEKLCL